ncbi:MAG: RNA methyltransferase [Cyclobacteriaceae bacterium]|nr:RNA methyltransferase [Cyclobacteriaceae bacterium]
MKKLKLEELGRKSVEEYKKGNKIPVEIVLDNVRSLHNVGSAFRTADAFLIKKIYLTGITGQPPHREIHKTALGAQDSVDWEYFPETTSLLKKLKASSKKVIAVEQTDSSSGLANFEIDEKEEYVLFFGNEVEGVSDEVIAQCDGCIEIPQYGTKHSLNVSVSIGIVLYEFSKKLNV